MPLGRHGRKGEEPAGPDAVSREVIRARGLGKRYGDKRVLEGLDLDLERGGFLLVTGPNGSGKTRCCGSAPGSPHRPQAASTSTRPGRRSGSPGTTRLSTAS